MVNDSDRVTILLMGVAGSGKSSIGRLLARSVGGRFIEGDAWHSNQNLQKMASGIPLNEEDRRPWLELLANELSSAVENEESVVLACSALKKDHRDQLRMGAPLLKTVWLHAKEKTLMERVDSRKEHFFSSTLITDQLAQLEPPKNCLEVDAEMPMQDILRFIVYELVSLNIWASH